MPKVEELPECRNKSESGHPALKPNRFIFSVIADIWEMTKNLSLCIDNHLIVASHNRQILFRRVILMA
jgi:hypothetical protein